MPSALIVARTCQFWAVATMLGGGGFLLLSAPVRNGLALLRLASIAAALSGAAWLALTLVGVTDDPGSVTRPDDWQAFFGTVLGPPWAVRSALLVACVAIVPARRPAPFVAVAVSLAVDQAWLGHAAAGTGLTGVAMIALYWAHVLAGFAWVGALVMLAATLRKRQAGEVVVALALFSKTGIWLVGLILASGLANASFRLDTAGELASTPYGRLIGLKLVLFLAMVALAALNRRSIRHRHGGRDLAVRLVAETGLGLAVLGVAAVLGVTPPPA